MKTKISVMGLGFLIALIFSGCTTMRPHIRPFMKAATTERVLNKNYELNQRLFAYVGQPIVRVKDYNIIKVTSQHMRASDNFVIAGETFGIRGNTNTDYTIYGDTVVDGRAYTVIALTERFAALIGTDGSVGSKLLDRGDIMYDEFKATPVTLRFSTTTKEEKIDTNSPFLNYELIYSGTDGESITIAYREYSRKDFARPAFHQNLVYKANEKKIRFKNTTLNIHEVTNEKIVFTVISDDLADKEEK